MAITIQNLTVRDYFAAQAMAVAIRLHEDWNDGAIPFLNEEGEDMGNEEGDWGTWFPQTKFFAQACYSIADEMMKERENHENK
jgi:hypothetical protein